MGREETVILDLGSDERVELQGLACASVLEKGPICNAAKVEYLTTSLKTA